MAKKQKVAVIASTRSGRRKVGEILLSKPWPCEVYAAGELDCLPSIGFKNAKRLGYPGAPGCVREKLVVSGGRIRG